MDVPGEEADDVEVQERDEVETPAEWQQHQIPDDKAGCRQVVCDIAPCETGTEECRQSTCWRKQCAVDVAVHTDNITD